MIDRPGASAAISLVRSFPRAVNRSVVPTAVAPSARMASTPIHGAARSQSVSRDQTSSTGRSIFRVTANALVMRAGWRPAAVPVLDELHPSGTNPGTGASSSGSRNRRCAAT